MLTKRELCDLLKQSGLKVVGNETIKDPSRSSSIPLEYVRAARPAGASQEERGHEEAHQGPDPRARGSWPFCCRYQRATRGGLSGPGGGHWVVRDFRFHTGEVLPELRLHYTTVGAPTGEPVLILHGTTGSGAGMLTPAFAGELFGPGQPLDASRYYIILPDAIGTRKVEPSRRTACARSSRGTTTTTWSTRSTAW